MPSNLISKSQVGSRAARESDSTTSACDISEMRWNSISKLQVESRATRGSDSITRLSVGLGMALEIVLRNLSKVGGDGQSYSITRAQDLFEMRGSCERFAKTGFAQIISRDES